MKDITDSVKNFCLIQLEILKVRRHKLRKDFQDCQIQEEFLLSILRDIGSEIQRESTEISGLINIEEREK
jgi:hypothetical protein